MSCIENKKSSNEKKIKADTDVCIEGRQFKKKKRLWKEESRKIKVSTVHISIEPRRSSGASGENRSQL